MVNLVLLLQQGGKRERFFVRNATLVEGLCVATPTVAREQSIHRPRMRQSLSYNDKHRQESNATVTQGIKSDICQKHKKLGAIFNSLIT